MFTVQQMSVDTVQDSEVETVQELSAAAVAESAAECAEAPVSLEAGTCDKTGHSYRVGPAAGAGVKRVVFRLGKQVLGQASFLSDTEEEEEEEEKKEKEKGEEEEEDTEKEERLVMDFPEDDEDEEGAVSL